MDDNYNFYENEQNGYNTNSIDKFVKAHFDVNENGGAPKSKEWTCTIDDKYKDRLSYDGLIMAPCMVEDFDKALDTDPSFKKTVVEYLNYKVDHCLYDISNFAENVDEENNEIFAENIDSKTLSEPIKISKHQKITRVAFMEVKLSDEEKIRLYSTYKKQNGILSEIPKKQTDNVSW